MLDLETVARELVRVLSRDARRFGLAPPLRAEYVPNPGGYVNHSFTVGGGPVRRHVKLSPDPARFDRQLELADLLTRRYRAPEILGRVELPETGLFECLSEDLIAVEADPEVRAWISPEDRGRLAAEVERLRAMGRERLSDDTCDTAIHGDLWLQNVLVSDGGWWLLDWDELGLGDPAADYTMLLHYARVDRGLFADLLPDDPDLGRRVDLLLRAASFDAIVDPLSDCTDMPAGLADREEVRAGKRRIHEVALARYREVYGFEGRNG